MRKRHLAVAALAALSMVAVSCGDGTTTSSNSGTSKVQSALVKKKNELMSQMQKEIGPGEGAINILAWPGYAESGKNDPKVNWVTPFETKTGCKANVLEFPTSDDAIKQIDQGDWDVVSASGDATLRLIAAGKVVPVNTALLKNYGDIAPFLKDKAWNSVDGQMFGVPHGWGANLLAYNSTDVTPAPDSWSVVFDPKSPVKGKVTAYDSPIYIADAAMYLKTAKPELGIKDPYALDDKQFTAAIDLLKQQKGIIGEYWGDYLKAADALKSGSSVLGTTWQVIVNTVADAAPIKTVEPKEGMTGWSDTWMVTQGAKHPNCAYMWMDWITSPEANSQVAAWFGEAPANLKACAVDAAAGDNCTLFHAKDEAYASKLYYWNTPQAECLDGRADVTCKTYKEWSDAWTEIKG